MLCIYQQWRYTNKYTVCMHCGGFFFSFYINSLFICSFYPLIISFSFPDNRMVKVNGTREPLEFKSHQWFGATVRTHRGKVVVSVPERSSPMNGPNEAPSVMLIGNELLQVSLDGNWLDFVFSIPSIRIRKLVVCEIKAHVVGC